MDAASGEKLAIRRALDAQMKNKVPGYSEAMAPVASDMELLSRAGKELGTEQQALSALTRVDSTLGAPKRDLIEELQKRMGKNYLDYVSPSKVAGAAEAEAARAELGRMAEPNWELERLQSLLEKSRANPQIQQLEANLEKARSSYDDMAHPTWQKTQLESKLGTSEQARAMEQAESVLSQSESALAPFGSMAPRADGRTGIQQKIKSIMSDNSIENKRMMEDLSRLTGEDFVRTIDNLRIKQAFEKGDRAGSSNVNFWGAIFGGALGTVGAGLPGMAGGAALGAGVGKFMDRYGPAVAKSILDQVIRVRGIPTVEKISQLNLPPQVKDELAKDLKLWFMDKHIDERVPLRVAQDERSNGDRMPAQKARIPEQQAQQQFIQGN
jgi:hypothetical protein